MMLNNCLNAKLGIALHLNTFHVRLGTNVMCSLVSVGGKQMKG